MEQIELITRKELPKPLFFIFEGVEEAFEEHWLLHEDENIYLDKQWKLKKWNWLVEWIEGWHELFWSIIPEGRVSCLIETKQQYAKFTAEELVRALEKLGELANYMYCAGRDYLIESHVLNPQGYYPLAQYYVSALESVLWMVATLKQDRGSFTDLTTRLRQCLEA
jgi:hypothetical protein